MKRGESLSWPTMIIERRYKRLNPTPEYQRDSVWSTPQKQLLIDSIIRNMDIPKLYFRVLPKGSKFDYEIIDGQQRIRAIWEYRQNEFPLSKKYSARIGELYYRDLPENIKDQLDLYQLQITVIDDANDDEIRDMFYRLQNGKPLNAAEKRNAIGGSMRDFIARLVDEHSVFKAYQRKNSRFSYEQMAAQCTLLEITGSITDVQNRQLERLYRQNKDFDPNSANARKISRVMNYLAKAFKEPTPEFKGRGQFVTLYWLVSQTLDVYTMSGHEKDLREFFIAFETKRQISKEEDVDMIRYSEALSRSSDGRERIQYRHDMLLREWLLYLPELALKDNQRNFTPEQRMAIYRRDKGICQLCGQAVELEDFEADHIVAHAQGGYTNLVNGQAAHKVCNASKGKR